MIEINFSLLVYRCERISPCGASFFLSDQKETKESLGEGLRVKTLRLRLVFSLPIPQTP